MSYKKLTIKTFQNRINKRMNDIKTRIVYLLRRTDKEDDGTDSYVGSTSLILKKRLQKHRHDAKIYNTKLYERMVENGPENWVIEPLRLHTCNKNKIREVEAKMVRRLQPDLNTRSPIDMENKWGNNGKEKLLRDLYYNHKQNKTYYCDVCEKAFGKKFNLEAHCNTLKHSYAFMNSVD